MSKGREPKLAAKVRLAVVACLGVAVVGCPSQVPDPSQFSVGDAVAAGSGGGLDGTAATDGDSVTDGNAGTDANLGTDAIAGTDANPGPDADAAADSDLTTQKQDIFTAGTDATAEDVPPADTSCQALGCPTPAPCHKATCLADGNCSDAILPDETPCGADKACHSGICLANPVKALRVVAGGETTCVLLVGGTVKCWGAGDSGQLGNGTLGNSATPVTVAGLSGATDLACGASHCCALGAGGKVWCWGSNQFGESNPVSKGSPQLAAIQQAGVGAASAIGAGDHHTCAVVAQGSVRCWGLGTAGQLGDGKADIPDKVVDADFAGSGYAMEIHGGANFTCARTALTTAFCWGDNGNGQIGNGNGGTSQFAYKPAAVVNLSDVKTLATGAQHACAVRNSGDVWCWGHAGSGELGNGSGNSYYSQPVQAQGMVGAQGVSAGDMHSCAIGAGGGVWCWGSNAAGQAGLAKSTSQTKTPVQLANFDGVEVAAGGSHSCARRADGSVWCWGANGLGQCGAGGGKDVFLPVKAW